MSGERKNDAEPLSLKRRRSNMQFNILTSLTAYFAKEECLLDF